MTLAEAAIDLALQQSIVRVLMCRHADCPQHVSCARVARFARDTLRDHHAGAIPHLEKNYLADTTDCGIECATARGASADARSDP